MRASLRLAGLALVCLALSGCGRDSAPPEAGQPTATEPEKVSAGGGEEQMAEFTLSSPAFGDGEQIPAEYACDGEDVSPPLVIEGVPEGSVSLALVVDDPDAPAGVWDHWLVWNLATDTSRISRDSLPEGAVVGRNDFGDTDWGGPCPPPGPAHRYRFTLYAVDTRLDLPVGATKNDLEEALEGHILSRTQLVGRYGR